MAAGKKKDAIKCEGRFHELRDQIYNELLPVVLEEGAAALTRQNLVDAWGFLEPEIHRFDLRDPYYYSRVDPLRRAPNLDPLSLVPLIEAPFHVPTDLVTEYALSMGNSEQVSRALALFNEGPKRYLTELGREPRKVFVPKDKSGEVSLAGYNISANFGVGTIAPGGVSGGGIRSDAPFLLEVYWNVTTGPLRGQEDLAALVGFWAHDNKMLVAQMQPCKNPHFPQEVKFGVGALSVAETVARQIGFNEIITYGARAHPIFKEHPEDWGQFGKDFVCIYDGSAKRLGYDGSRGNGGGHHKLLGTK